MLGRVMVAFTGLPDGIPKNPIWIYFGVTWKENCWYILYQFWYILIWYILGP
jgi:hypothetical protein